MKRSNIFKVNIFKRTSPSGPETASWNNALVTNLNKTPEQVREDALTGIKNLIGTYPTFKLSETQRRKLRNKNGLRTKVLDQKEEVDFVNVEEIPNLVDKKVLKQLFTYFDTIRESGKLLGLSKKGEIVQDWGKLYQTLEALGIPKGAMGGKHSSNADKLINDHIFNLAIYEPVYKNIVNWAVYENGYQINAGGSDYSYHICLGLPSLNNK